MTVFSFAERRARRLTRDNAALAWFDYNR
jgi:hypothetical protein